MPLLVNKCEELGVYWSHFLFGPSLSLFSRGRGREAGGTLAFCFTFQFERSHYSLTYQMTKNNYGRHFFSSFQWACLLRFSYCQHLRLLQNAGSLFPVHLEKIIWRAGWCCLFLWSNSQQHRSHEWDPLCRCAVFTKSHPCVICQRN